MVPREGHLPGLERRVQGQSSEAVITGAVLLKTQVKGSRLEHRVASWHYSWPVN